MKIILIILIIILLGTGCYFLLFKHKEQPVSLNELNMTKVENKKIAMIVAFSDFRDEEYFVPRKIFDQSGAKVSVVSDKPGTAKGTEGGEVDIEMELNELNVKDFDAIVFIGGPGAINHLDNQLAYKIAQEAVEQNKILSAICISPSILAKAGVLRGKKATVWTSALNKEAQKVLEENGAIFQKDAVVQDGKIITANGPSAAKDFAEKILDALK